MAAATAGSMAASGLKAGAQGAQRGLITISTVVQNNPACVKVFCCILGAALSFCSWLSILNVVAHVEWHPKEILQCIYVSVFGGVIVLCDIKEQWANQCFDIQKKFFQYFYFLATQTGRAMFYFYVGSITLLMLPESDIWRIVFVILGGLLCFMGLLLIALRYCPSCCGPAQGQQ
eukprot:TRINITY_DN76809_c0_g1_i1.p1 TRINITY_DN76809_c0_g1~~TRINITY_DN76809_c0_g1_i1.p1  ORF type:complete len:175 (-),score=40.48 TRINITY_DN76809_c0_g1_i1:138-662(-)